MGSRTRQLRKDAAARDAAPMRFVCPVCDEQRLLVVREPDPTAEVWTRCPCGYETRIMPDPRRSRWRVYGQHDNLYPTFRDLASGATAKCDDKHGGMSLFWWSEGNGGCDCNRVGYFDAETCPPDETELEREEDLDEYGSAMCLGHRRYVVIDVEGDITDAEKPEAIARMNEGYEEAIAKHGVAA